MKMRTQNGKWYITDNGRQIEFDNGQDAWLYGFTMASVRPIKTAQPSTYPVRSLVPPTGTRCAKCV